MSRPDTLRRFAPPPWAILLTVAALAALTSLGTWQLGRARQKQALMEEFAAGARETVDATGRDLAGFGRYQRVRLRGRYDASYQVLLDNMPSAQGQPGYRVLTPLARADGRGRVLVDRGWVPLGATREQLPDLAVGTDEREVSGVLDALPEPGLRVGPAAAPGDTAWPRVLLFPTETDLGAAFGYEVGPRIILLDAEAADGYERQWRPSLGFGPERHLGYAIQWFALAIAAVVIFVAVNLRGRPREEEAASR
jgi:cytochrome oxidase assembly protein ShyY1